MLTFDLQRFALPGEEVITDDNDLGDLDDLDSELFTNTEIDEFGNVVGQQQQQSPAGNQEQQTEGQGQEQQPSDGGQDQDQPADQGQQQKPPQSPEENARFAAMRREREFQERLERELQARLQQRPEFQLAQILSQHYNMPVEQLVPALQQMTLQQQSEATGIPVQVLQQIQQLQQQVQQAQTQVQQIEQERLKLEYQQWQAQKDAERAQVKQMYPFLTDQDIDAAMVHMLQNVGTINFDLRQAVRFVHGDKIEEGLRRQAEQEALARLSGRKNPLPTQGGKPSDTADALTEEELYAARMLGVKPEDYAKYRDPQ